MHEPTANQRGENNGQTRISGEVRRNPRTIRRRVAAALRDGMSDELFTFYRCYRATLRARLAIAHLLERDPRTPDKWPELAKTYLQLAFTDALWLEKSLLVKPRAASRRGRRLFLQ